MQITLRKRIQVKQFMEKSNSIKIDLRPLIVTFVIISIFVAGGFAWDSIRTSDKLKTLGSHTQDIYNAHKTEFISLSESKNPSEINIFLENVNSPEQGIYSVGIIVKEANAWVLYEQAPENPRKSILSENQILEILTAQKSGVYAINKDVFKNLHFKDNLYGFAPINNDDGSLLGFVLVRLSKTQDI